MRITQITLNNLERRLESILSLIDEFQVSLGEPQVRAMTEKRNIVRKMVGADQTVLLLLDDENGTSVGVCYYNKGTGYSCGGEYIWINCVYVRGGYRREGYGAALLDRVEADAHEREVELIICARDIENLDSDRLFAKCDFEQEHQVVITKRKGRLKGQR